MLFLFLFLQNMPRLALASPEYAHTNNLLASEALSAVQGDVKNDYRLSVVGREHSMCVGQSAHARVSACTVRRQARDVMLGAECWAVFAVGCWLWDVGGWS